MITFTNLNIEGFCSYEKPISLNLNLNQVILVEAPNGSGKSTLFAAIFWVLYGKTLKGNSDVNTWEAYRTKEYMGTKVEIFFNTQKGTYKIIRCQNYKGILEDGAKGNNRLIIYKDAELVDIKGKVQLQDYINRVLGISQKLFLNSIMFGQGIAGLIKESNTDKKKLFEEVFNLNYLNVAKDLAKQAEDKVDNKLRDVVYSLDSLNKEYDSTKKAYKDLKDREDNFKEHIDRRKSKILKQKKEKESQLKEAKEGYSVADHSLIETRVSKIKKSINNTKNKLEEARNISKIPLIEVIDKVIKYLEHNKPEIALKKAKVIRKAYVQIDKYSSQLEKERDKYDTLQDKLDDYEYTANTIKDLEKSIEALDITLQDILKEKIKVISPKYRHKAREIKSKLKKVKLEKDKLSHEFEDYHWLIQDPLSNSGIKAFIFESSLNILNDTLERYSKILGFRISFDVDLESTKKDFVTLIERDDQIIDYDELSGGEKQLVNVAMAFAMNESLTASKGINIAFLDEVFESLDPENIELVVTLINQICEDKTVFIITHQTQVPISNVKVMQVTKQDGISDIKLL